VPFFYENGPGYVHRITTRIRAHSSEVFRIGIGPILLAEGLYRPRCRGCKSEVLREGRGAVSSRSTGRHSFLRRFRCFIPAAATCAGMTVAMVVENGIGVRGRCTGVKRFRRPTLADFGNCSTRVSPRWGSEGLPNTVSPGAERKKLSIPTGRCYDAHRKDTLIEI